MDAKGHLPLGELEGLARVEKNAARARRLRIIILGLQGWTAPAVVVAVGLSRCICQRWGARDNAEGLAGLDDRRGQEPGTRLSAEQEAAFRLRVEAGPTDQDLVCSLRGKDFQLILAEEFHVWRSLPAIDLLQHRLGHSCLRPRPKHRRADHEVRESFPPWWPKRIGRIAQQHPDQQLHVYFQDESRFGQQGTNTNVWARKGSRPMAVRQTEYEYLWVLGVVGPETGHAEGLLSPQWNTRIIHEFLELFSPTIPDREHAVMVWDGASFHRAKALQIPENISVVELPPYSRELNPIENLWHYLKSHFWSNHAYDNYDELEATAMQAWKHAALDHDHMKTTCAAGKSSRSLCRPDLECRDTMEPVKEGNYLPATYNENHYGNDTTASAME